MFTVNVTSTVSQRIVNEAQLQYNAMQIGVVQLLREREQQIETSVAYVDALREYWLARADLEQMSSGRLPASRGVVQRAGLTELTITGIGPFPYQLDGDYLGEAESLSIRYEPACLDLYVP